MIEKLRTIRAHLHFHGSIGLQDKWMNVQGYDKNNFAKQIIDAALDRKIGLVNFISEDHEIPRGNLDYDRFYFMLDGLKRLPKEYSHDRIGDVALIVEKKNSGRVIFTNGQVPVIEDNGKRYDHIVVGTNQVPNHRSLDETIKYCTDMGLIQIAEHPFLTEHFGIGEELFAKHSGSYDAIEGHNAQMLLPAYLSFLPIIGISNRRVNEKAKEFSRKYKKPYIASSDAHNLDKKNGFGSAYIEFCEFLLDFSNEERFLASLKQILKNRAFELSEGYASFSSWFRWCSQFVIGHKSLPKQELTSTKENSD